MALTKPNSERCAVANLARQGYTTYLPLYLQRQVKGLLVKPLFPRYLFILIDKQFHSINSTYGISYLLMNETRPVTVNDDIIQELRARENNKGIIVLPHNPRFKIGEHVKLAKGPLAGYNLLYDGMSDADRAYVLMEILGRKVSIVVDEKSLMAASQEAVALPQEG